MNFLAEHFMYMATSMYENYLKLTYCNDATYPDDFFKNYINTNRPHLMHNIPYSAWELPLYEVSSLENKKLYKHNKILSF